MKITRSVQFSCSVVSNSLRPHGLQYAKLPCPSPTPTSEFAQTHILRVGDAIQPSHPLLYSCLQSFPSSESLLMSQFSASGDHKYWSFSFSISPFNEYSRLISFRIDWFDLLAVQGILKSLLQHHSSKASIP